MHFFFLKKVTSAIKQCILKMSKKYAFQFPYRYVLFMMMYYYFDITPKSNISKIIATYSNNDSGELKTFPILKTYIMSIFAQIENDTPPPLVIVVL